MFKYLPNENTFMPPAGAVGLLVQWKSAYQEVAAQYGLPTDETQIDANDIYMKIKLRPYEGWSLPLQTDNSLGQLYQSLMTQAMLCQKQLSYIVRSIQQCQPVHSSLPIASGSWRNDDKIRCEQNLMKLAILPDKANQESQIIILQGKLEDARHANSNVAVEMANVKKTIQNYKILLVSKDHVVGKGEGDSWCISRSDWSSHPTKRSSPSKAKDLLAAAREKLDLLKAEEAESPSRSRSAWGLEGMQLKSAWLQLKNVFLT